MAFELTITAKGQVTLRQAVLDHLGVKPGDKVGVSLLPDDRVELAPASAQHDLSSAGGMLLRRGQRPTSLATMQDAIASGRQRGRRKAAPNIIDLLHYPGVEEIDLESPLRRKFADKKGKK